MDRDQRPSTPWMYRFLKSRRGQSESLGVVLLLSITIASTVVIVAFGAPAISETKQGMRTKNVEHSMTQLDAKVAEVALGRAPSMKASLPPTGANSDVRVTDDGWVRVRVYNQTTGALREQLVNESMGSLEYEIGDTKVVYQGGGVWRKQGEGVTMISPPEFHYRQETLTLPIVTVSGSASAPESVVIEQENPTTRVYPNATQGRRNPLRNARVNITIKSEYYEAWGAFFRTRTAGKPFYDDDRNRVTFTLVVTRQTGTTVSAGVIAGGGGTDLALDKKASADSFNSSVGLYSATASDNTTMIVGGDLDMDKGSRINGELVVGGDTTIKKDVLIDGNLSYGAGLSLSTKNVTVDGWVAANASVTEPDPVGWLIDKKSNVTSDGNDNEKAGVDIINDSTPRMGVSYDGDCTGGCNIHDGEYRLRKIDMDSNSRIIINNSNGPVTVYVNGDVYINSNTVIELTSDKHPVRFYVKGDTSIAKNFRTVVPGQKAPLFWLYHDAGSSADIEKGLNYTGVIYGPGSASNQGVDIDIAKNATFYGAMVGQVTNIDKTMNFHYDEALARVAVVPDSQSVYIPTVNYLHITMNNVTVTD